MGILDGVKREQRELGIRAVEIWCQHVLGEAQRGAPVEEGTLRASGEVTVERTADGADFTISFSTPYAAKQHEELGYRHPTGGHAKYLETPFKANLPRLAPVVAAAVAKAAR